MKLVSLGVVKRNKWYIKASVFDDQILIFLWNENKIETYFAMFYNEEAAYNFIEGLKDNDNYDLKISNR